MNCVPEVLDEWKLVSDKVEEGEDDKHGNEPALGDEGEVRVHAVQVQPAGREGESEQGQVGIQAGGECQAQGCTESDEIHGVFLLDCMCSLP